MHSAMGQAIRKVCEALGISWVWWQWRWMNFKSRVAFKLSLQNNLFRRLRSPQKVCRCGALAAGDQKECVRCGRKLPSQASWFLYKVFGLVVPGVAAATGLLSGIIFLDFALTVLRGGVFTVISPDGRQLVSMGALFAPLIADGQWWRVCTCVFLHIGIIHLAFNSLALLSVSRFLEDEIGFHRYVSVFLLTGLGGSLATLYARSYPVVSAGASGAIFGLIGFAIAYYKRERTSAASEVRTFMVRWAIYGFVFGFLLGADNFAHAGGFVTGLLLGYLTEHREDERRRREVIWRTLAWGAVMLYAVAFVQLFLTWR